MNSPGDDISRLEQRVRDAPEDAGAHFDLGRAWHAAGQMALARQSYRMALMLDPGHRGARAGLGEVLAASGEGTAALDEFDTLLATAPDDAGVLANKGNALRDLGRFDEADACFDAALAARPGDPRLLANRALARQFRGDVDGAIALFREACAAAPDDAVLRFNLAQALLLGGHFKEGFAAFETRLEDPEIAAHFAGLESPRWDGADAAGRRILVVAEQGHGDAIQFARFVPELARRGARPILAVPAAMMRLFAGLDGDVEIADRAAPPAHDLHVPLLSLPHVLGLREEDFNAAVPYLAPEPGLVAYWAARLGGDGKRRVGIAWQGNPAYEWDRLRSIPVERLAPLFDVADTEFFALQKDAAGLPAGLHDLGPELDCEAAFADTAAVMASLDLVISSDTAIPHLAGALARPVWLLTSSAPDWRWQLGRTDSPWYPTMRLFRQPAPGDWGSVIAEAAAALEQIMVRRNR